MSRKQLRTPVFGRGFTLVELCVGLAIGSILGIGMMTLMRGGSSIFAKQNSQLEALQSSMMISSIIKEDLSCAVLSPSTKEITDQSGATVNAPDYRPFIYDQTLEAPDASSGDRPRPPVATVPPVDIGGPGEDVGNGASFVFFRTINNEAASTVAALDDGSGGLTGLGLNEPFTVDAGRGYTLIAVRYSAEPVKVYKGKKYFCLKREEFLPGAAEASSVKVYDQFRLRKLVFFTIAQDWDNVMGEDNFTIPPEEPWYQTVIDLAQQVLGMIMPGTNSSAPAQNGPGPAVVRDQCFYIQFFVSGISSKPNIKDFETYTHNTLVGTVCFDALTEKMRTKNAAQYWNTHSASDGYITTGEFELPPD
jgi:prepilin-type N-terminal cleavage/methylation domain-containing protein